MLLHTLTLQVVAVPTGALAGSIVGEDLFVSIFKYSLFLGAFLYVLFAGIVIRQIVLMERALITTISPILTLMGWLHFLLALCVFLLFWIIL